MTHINEWMQVSSVKYFLSSQVVDSDSESEQPLRETAKLFSNRLACVRVPTALRDFSFIHPQIPSWFRDAIVPLLDSTVEGVSWIGTADTVDDFLRTHDLDAFDIQSSHSNDPHDAVFQVQNLGAIWHHPRHFEIWIKRHIQLSDAGPQFPSESIADVLCVINYVPGKTAAPLFYDALLEHWCERHNILDANSDAAWVAAPPTLMQAYWSARQGGHTGSIIALAVECRESKDKNLKRLIYDLSTAQRQRRALGLSNRPIFGLWHAEGAVHVLSSIWLGEEVRILDHEVTWSMDNMIHCTALHFFVQNIYTYAEDILAPEFNRLNLKTVLDRLDSQTPWRAPRSIKSWYGYFNHPGKDYPEEHLKGEDEDITEPGLRDHHRNMQCPHCHKWFGLNGRLR